MQQNYVQRILVFVNDLGTVKQTSTHTSLHYKLKKKSVDQFFIMGNMALALFQIVLPIPLAL